MKTLMTKALLPALLITVLPALGQVNYHSASANIEVAGTSTLHDWVMTSSAANVTAVFAFDAAGKLSGISNLSFSMGPTSLKSGKGAMDDNAYKSLKTESFNIIKFTATGGTVTAAGGTSFTVKCPGVMTIAGKSVSTDLVASCTVGADGLITCSGKKGLKMTEFGVKPPSFMMGTIKTGDDLNISFKTVLRK